MTAPFITTSHSSSAVGSDSPQNPGCVNIKVAVRLRPLLEDSEVPKEKRRKNQDKRAWKIEKMGSMDTLIQKGYARKVEGRTVFHFDQVFDEDIKTPLLYKSIARPMVREFLNGKHASIFTYGQTGSGKTFTIQGDGMIGSGQAGIIQLVLSDLFRFTRKGEARKRDFEVKVSYFEIYNEKIRDLLSDDTRRTPSAKMHEMPSGALNVEEEVKIRTNAFGETVVNVVQKKVSSVDEALEFLVKGNAHRTVASTDMNEHSSRSHSVFRLTVESRDVSEQDSLRVSDFNLVDLAGSESLKATNGSRTQQREGAMINKSLLALTTVIQSLSQPVKNRPQHINYRDSKLTRILHPHLSGNAEMAILCCVSPSKTFVEETRSTLKFATRAKLVQMKPKINEVMDDRATIRMLQNELLDVRRQLAELRSPGQAQEPVAIGTPCGVDENRIDESDRCSDTEAQSKAKERKYETLNDPSVPELIQEREHNDSNDTLRRPNGEGVAYSSVEADDIPCSRDDAIIVEKLEYLPSMAGDGGINESLASGFRLDAADADVANKTVRRYQRGRVDSLDPDDFLNSSDDSEAESFCDRIGYSIENARTNNTQSVNKRYLESYGADGSFDSSDKRIRNNTAPTEVDSFNGPEASYSEISLKLGSQISNPETIRGSLGEIDRGISKGEFAPNGRLENMLSQDTINLTAKFSNKIGVPVRAFQSISTKNGSIPDEVTIIDTVSITGNNVCLTDRLNNAEARIKFLERKLDVSGDIIEATFRDLERARHCIRDLVYRHVQMKVVLNRKRREDTKEAYEQGEVIVEQYWILRVSLYVSLFFFLSGSQEFFLATVFFVWLALETNVTA